MRNLGDLVVILDKHREMTRLDRGKLAEDLVAILAEEVRNALDAGRSFDGSDFADLSSAYAEWKGRHHTGKPIGELTGKMKAAVEELPGGVRIVFDRMYVEFAAGDEDLRAYALAFNDGVPDRNQPARPFLGFSARCRERMAARIQRHVADGLKG